MSSFFKLATIGASVEAWSDGQDKGQSVAQEHRQRQGDWQEQRMSSSAALAGG